ncbi:MAG TPA: hypothetical protein DHN29_11105 [Cytophagales bacterium]|jgi:hypothetical protein|nr:hypothetical protein [Cytophagales bacterium]|tara:strand:- start:228 stop:518 length:291 start_codon:yes stop_codon:yes gene_type:complete
MLYFKKLKKTKQKDLWHYIKVDDEAKTAAEWVTDIYVADNWALVEKDEFFGHDEPEEEVEESAEVGDEDVAEVETSEATEDGNEETKDEETAEGAE